MVQGEPGGFDDDAAKSPDLAGIAPLDQAAQSPRQVFAHGAAQTTPRQFEDIALDKVDEVMIDRDLADLVDDDGGVGEFRRDERPAQERRFAAAQKARQQGRRQGLRFGHSINHSISANPPQIVSRGWRGGKFRRQNLAITALKPVQSLANRLHYFACASSMPAIKPRHERQGRVSEEMRAVSCPAI